MNPIKSDPQILGGTPCFAGTRVPVKNLFDLLERGSQRQRVARQLGARRVGQVFALPRDRHRDQLRDERREQQRHDPDGEEEDRERPRSAAALVGGTAPPASPPEAAPRVALFSGCGSAGPEGVFSISSGAITPPLTSSRSGVTISIWNVSAMTYAAAFIFWASSRTSSIVPFM